MLLSTSTASPAALRNRRYRRRQREDVFLAQVELKAARSTIAKIRDNARKSMLAAHPSLLQEGVTRQLADVTAQ